MCVCAPARASGEGSPRKGYHPFAAAVLRRTHQLAPSVKAACPPLSVSSGSKLTTEVRGLRWHFHIFRTNTVTTVANNSPKATIHLLPSPPATRAPDVFVSSDGEGDGEEGGSGDAALGVGDVDRVTAAPTNSGIWNLALPASVNSPQLFSTTSPRAPAPPSADFFFSSNA